ncbi:MAG: hypothetical protein KBT04_06460 [Bacteroidales bacterium]|nr:hypothetical protein [Candidatus Colimorpha onthohippi]
MAIAAHKKVRSKSKRYSITLSEREGEWLKRYAEVHHCSRPDAVRRIVKSCLKDFNKNYQPGQPDNQLSIFDVSYQLNLFDGIEETDAK